MGKASESVRPRGRERPSSRRQTPLGGHTLTRQLLRRTPPRKQNGPAAPLGESPQVQHAATSNTTPLTGVEEQVSVAVQVGIDPQAPRAGTPFSDDSSFQLYYLTPLMPLMNCGFIHYIVLIVTQFHGKTYFTYTQYSLVITAL